jgi:hypothetical protein
MDARDPGLSARAPPGRRWQLLTSQQVGFRHGACPEEIGDGEEGLPSAPPTFPRAIDATLKAELRALKNLGAAAPNDLHTMCPPGKA